MHSEMITNAQSEEVAQMREWNESGNSVSKIQALVAWANKVRVGSDWDHKPKLDSLLGLSNPDNPELDDFFFPIAGDTEHEYYYDIWSNIHYGYVGTAAGFDAETLQTGPAIPIPGLTGRNDHADVLSIQIGIDLWNQYGPNLTPEQLGNAILEHRDDYLAIQEEYPEELFRVDKWRNGR